MKKSLLLVLFCLCSFIIHAQFQKATFMIKGNTLPYEVMFPKDYDKSKQYPLLVFLHGAGERGNDNEKQLTHGKDFLINNFYSKYPAIVIAPQCPLDSYWSNVQSNAVAGERIFKFDITNDPSKAMETLKYLINEWLGSGKINTKRVYAGGLSMGAMGTYELLWRMPDQFTAAFTICGGGNIENVMSSTYNIPIWIFHGAADSVVPVQASRDMFRALTDAGNNVKYTEYKGVDHNSWDNVFQNNDLATWLFAFSKKR